MGGVDFLELINQYIVSQPFTTKHSLANQLSQRPGRIRARSDENPANKHRSQRAPTLEIHLPFDPRSVDTGPEDGGVEDDVHANGSNNANGSKNTNGSNDANGS